MLRHVFFEYYASIISVEVSLRLLGLDRRVVIFLLHWPAVTLMYHNLHGEIDVQYVWSNILTYEIAEKIERGFWIIRRRIIFDVTLKLLYFSFDIIFSLKVF